MLHRRSISLVLALALSAVAAACTVRPASSSPPAVGGSNPAPSPTVAASATLPAPTAPITSAPDPSSPAAPAPTAVLDCDEPGDCRVSLVDIEGNALPGWPVTLEGWCPGAATGPEGRVYVVCHGENRPVVHALDRGGVESVGWPVRLPATPATVSFNDFSSICGRHLSPLAVAADGGVYVSTVDEATRLLHSFDRDGRQRDGWPQPMPGDNLFRCGGFALLADGTLRVWGYEGPPPVEIELGYDPFAERTIFTALRADGSTLPGWPFGSTGTGSGPLLGADGTLYHLSQGGNVWAHGTDGEPKAGWPYRLGATWMSPFLAPDGRIVLVGINDGEILALGPDGAVVAGWPQRILVPRESPCSTRGDVDCFGAIDPAFGPDGTLYVAIAPISDGLGGSVLAFGPNGAMVQGWPAQLPDLTRITNLSVDGVGNLVVGTALCGPSDCAAPLVTGTSRISPAGEWLD